MAWAPSSFRSGTSSLPITSVGESSSSQVHNENEPDAIASDSHRITPQPYHSAVAATQLPRNALVFDPVAARNAAIGASGAGSGSGSGSGSGRSTLLSPSTRVSLRSVPVAPSSNISPPVAAPTSTSTSTGTTGGSTSGSDPSHDRPPSFDDLSTHSGSQLPLSTLRGTVLLKLAKPTKIKHISLSFYGVSKTQWAQSARMPMFAPDDFGQPASEIVDAVVVNSHEWNFLDLEWPGATNPPPSSSPSNSTLVLTDIYGADAMVPRHDGKLRVYDRNNMAPPPVPLFGPSGTHSSKVKQSAPVNKESVVFPAGEYVFNFNLAIDATTPETLSAPYGSIRYFLQPKVIRSGPFNPNISARQEVELVRSPPNNCDVAFNNPIVINRIWDRRLEYEIVIPRKYVPLETSIPISLTFTRHDKVKLHRVKIYLVEIVQYTYSGDKTIEYTDTSLRILLEDKKGKTECQHTRANVACTTKCQRRIVGDLLQEDSQSTSFLFESPLHSDDPPFRQPFRTNYHLAPSHVNQLRPDSISSPYIKIRHRLMMSFRASKETPDSPKRRHFEIRIDTPIVFLSPKCVDENVELPGYAPPSYESHDF